MAAISIDGAKLTGVLRLTWNTDHLAHVLEHSQTDEPPVPGPTLGNCIRRARLRWSPGEPGSAMAACCWRPVRPDLAGCAMIPSGA